MGKEVDAADRDLRTFVLLFQIVGYSVMFIMFLAVFGTRIVAVFDWLVS